jgi:hypothetical protein
MTTYNTNEETGLATTSLSSSIDAQCVAVHTEFLKSHKLDRWALTVVGAQKPYVWANSYLPDGRPETQEAITLTLDFPKDLREFLEREYRIYLARQ